MSEPAVREEVVEFEGGGNRLWGILSRPGDVEAAAGRPVVLIVTGGPQYRAGSHRMFVSLGRRLAAAGYPSLRFDYAGMGDSEGEKNAFDTAGPDMREALAELMQRCPSAPGAIVWGLCDAASAALMFLADDERVLGIVAANPWARSDATLAATRVKHYYLARLLQRDFWRKLLGGGLRWRESLASFRGDLRAARVRGGELRDGSAAAPFQQRMADGLRRLRGPMLLLLSGNDLTAKEFTEYTSASEAWRGLLRPPQVERIDLPEADHTFSRRRWLSQVEAETLAWLERLRGADAAPRRAITP